MKANDCRSGRATAWVGGSVLAAGGGLFLKHARGAAAAGVLEKQAAANAQAIEAEFASEAKQIVAESAFFAGGCRLILRRRVPLQKRFTLLQACFKAAAGGRAPRGLYRQPRPARCAGRGDTTAATPQTRCGGA
ncbi:MAG: hypothetical protein Pg6A_12200 [Termitinemataceae bacterium]|nr:MAG: hypothetical protein Pg6A_12200 [Termitinemataceae bacterium]